MKKLNAAALGPTIVGCAAFIQSFDASAVTIALPQMARGFGVDPLALNMVVTGYLMGATALLPACGWAAERFGARFIFLLAIVLFGLTSIACGLSTSLGWLVLMRMLQGGAGALLLPVGRIIVVNSVPREKLVSAMAMLTAPVLLGPILGPSLGGVIVTYASWRWLFFVNVPVAMLGLVLVFRFLPPIPAHDPKPLDWRGLVLLSLTLSSFTYGVGLGARRASAAWVIAAILLTGLAAGFAYLRHARRHRHPIIDPAVLRIQTVAATNIGGFFPRMLVGGVPFLLTMLFQVGFGMTAVEAGGLIFATAIGSISGRPLLGALLRRHGFRRMLTGSALATAVSVAICGLFTAQTPHAVIFVVLLVQGLLRTLQLTAVMTLGYADLNDRDLGAASTLSSLSQQLAISCGVALALVGVQMSQAVWGKAALGPGTIGPVFVLLALCSLASLYWIRRLPADVGARMARGKEPVVADPTLEQDA